MKGGGEGGGVIISLCVHPFGSIVSEWVVAFVRSLRALSRSRAVFFQHKHNEAERYDEGESRNEHSNTDGFTHKVREEGG